MKDDEIDPNLACKLNPLLLKIYGSADCNAHPRSHDHLSTIPKHHIARCALTPTPMQCILLTANGLYHAFVYNTSGSRDVSSLRSLFITATIFAPKSPISGAVERKI